MLEMSEPQGERVTRRRPFCSQEEISTCDDACNLHTLQVPCSLRKNAVGRHTSPVVLPGRIESEKRFHLKVALAIWCSDSPSAAAQESGPFP